MTEIIEEFEKLYSKIIQLDQEIYMSGFPFRIKLEKWQSTKKFHPKIVEKNSGEIKDYISYKIEFYPDPRLIYG